MKSIVDEFNLLPDATKHSIPKKTREIAAELQVSVEIESSFKILSEELELAVAMFGEQLQEDPAMVESQTEIGSLMKLLLEPPYVDSTSQTLPAETSMANDFTSAKSSELSTGMNARNICIMS